MNPYLLLLELAGAITLLLFAVRMVRTGIERGQEPRLRRLLRESDGGKLRTVAIGAGVAALLQSSTAVILLSAGFAAAGTLSTTTGLTLMLGADVGSAIAAQLLSLDAHWIIAVLLIVGGFLFFKGPDRDRRQIGRILIGVALIFISLRMVGEATAPLRTSPELPAIVSYLGGDLVTAFLIGGVFTWLVHSSVASILLTITMLAQGLMPIELGVALVLGVNFGGGFVAVVLTRNSDAAARRIAWGNFSFRTIGSVTALAIFGLFGLPLNWLGHTPALQAVNLHLAFNIALMLVFLPFTGAMAKLMQRLVGSRSGQIVEPLPDAASALDQAVVGVPALALASATRELLRMAEIVERMLKPLMELYETGDPEKIRQAKKLEEAVDAAQSDIKLYLARISYGHEDEARRGHELSSFAINLEYVGDAITKTLLKLAETRRDQKLQFSPEGWQELSELHHRVMANMQLALNVLVSKDRESARQLLEEKEAMGSAERASYNEHLRRLRSGAPQVVETSNIHLETVRALKTINSLFASVAYPILRESGDLLDSRLVERLSRSPT